VPPSNRLLAVLAALMGASGVALAAASTHLQGGELGRTAALFLILHAAALIAVAAQRARAATIVGFALAAGAIVFAADLAARAFVGARLFPFAAPVGGTTMILAWLALAVAFARL